MVFSDVLYGSISIPNWLIPFVKSPEFLRLRGVRLSNVDSFQFKDFNAPTRWEHCISVAFLALQFAEIRKLTETETVHLVLAALFHDIATPPFAHTMEYVLDGFDHETESYKILNYQPSDNIDKTIQVFAHQLPKFQELIESTSRLLNIKIDTEEVARLVIGDSKYGYVIKGTIDIDNIDNVSRASLYMGIKVDRDVPIKLIRWLAQKETFPTNLQDEENEAVKAWLEYRYLMYRSFYYSSDEELGRQAFLQHLIRRLNSCGLDRSRLIYNTDDGLLNLLETVESRNFITHTNFQNSLKDLVINYRLFSDTIKVCEIAIEDHNEMRLFNNPLFSEWLEKHLSTKHFEPFVFVKKRRFEEREMLFESPLGSINIFKLHNSPLKYSSLPDWLKNMIPENIVGDKLQKQIQFSLQKKAKEWLIEKPWHYNNDHRVNDVRTNLKNIDNWDFKLSRNETTHSYPATFVHAIPASLISALGLKGETILDPFGGSGVTAMEAIKQGCNVLVSDTNAVSHLIMKSKFSYIDADGLKYIKSITKEDILKSKVNADCHNSALKKWHHIDTELELNKIKVFIGLIVSLPVKHFLTVCFSDTLNFTTERKGKDFAYFADNTPLPKGTLSPKYVSAIPIFLSRVQRNLNIVEKTYFHFERQNRIVEQEFARVNVKSLDALTALPCDYGIDNNTVDAIITSPPYLCMVDYTYGNRLPYYWLFPERFNDDFKVEIGSRRSRANAEKAMIDYFTAMRKFARNSSLFLKKDGYLATVIGAPIAQKYVEKNIIDEIYKIFDQEGYELLWSSDRQIQWHRNHGLAKLKEERIAVHVKR